MKTYAVKSSPAFLWFKMATIFCKKPFSESFLIRSPAAGIESLTFFAISLTEALPSFCIISSIDISILSIIIKIFNSNYKLIYKLLLMH